MALQILLDVVERSREAKEIILLEHGGVSLIGNEFISSLPLNLIEKCGELTDEILSETGAQLNYPQPFNCSSCGLRVFGPCFKKDSNVRICKSCYKSLKHVEGYVPQSEVSEKVKPWSNESTVIDEVYYYILILKSFLSVKYTFGTPSEFKKNQIQITKALHCLVRAEWREVAEYLDERGRMWRGGNGEEELMNIKEGEFLENVGMGSVRELASWGLPDPVLVSSR